MSYLITAPEVLTSTAADVESIGSAIRAASADAAGPTTGLLAAADDEVSAAIAKLFAGYGQEYQALVSQAATFHGQFTAALMAAANTYAQAEAANAALAQTLLGPAPVAGGSGFSALATTLSSPSGDPLYALIMGGTNNPQPDPIYLNSVYNSFIKPLFPTAIPQALFTSEQFWPVTPGLGNMTFGQSVTAGVARLNTAINSLLFNQPNNSAVVFGYSQSATIATNEINALMAAGSPYQGQLSFMLIGDPNNPVGGILERFPGFYIPLLDTAFNGATPPNSPYPTTIYTAQYDGIADLPQYPLNLVSDLNALMGYFFVHNTYPLMTATQVANAVPLPTSPGYTGDTHYYMLMTQNLPLLQPIRAIPFAGPPIADIFQPDLRVLVDLGYTGFGPGADYANIPTPAGLFEIPNPLTIIPDLALGTVQGPYGAAVEIGVESGLLSPSYFPNAYPWVPSINPGLNISLGQSSTTLLSLLSGTVGNVLHIIPPPVFP
ncbi:PE-PPE domain-containing protein [Mycobacterium sp. 852002-51057_SCH5723018]|uniref:PE family protein n=1 Tax=Mycobacterium sp. 852002-51057_SCH5723018 TaxID=1834094 RepID=UPI000800A624|nr:PE-PPE domain-containing protein [Mycobacterium sp. 852002-51057_SCH5723018]OBG23730.1 PE family protein [Mycobacterium sp. 852002-51057_SCH5723018]